MVESIGLVERVRGAALDGSMDPPTAVIWALAAPPTCMALAAPKETTPIERTRAASMGAFGATSGDAPGWGR